MFHAAGWTFPWANVFSFATQVCKAPSQRNAQLTRLSRLDYITDCGLHHYLATSTSVRRHTLLWCANRPGMDELRSKITTCVTDGCRLV
jgi:hypothetical protein